MPRLQPVGIPGHWPPEFWVEASNGENSPPGPSGVGLTVNWTRDPSACGVLPVGVPLSARPVSCPGAEGSFQRHCSGPGTEVLFGNAWTNVKSRWLLSRKPSMMVAGVAQPLHGVVLKIWLNEFESGSCAPETPCGTPRIGGSDASPKEPILTSMR